MLCAVCLMANPNAGTEAKTIIEGHALCFVHVHQWTYGGYRSIRELIDQEKISKGRT